MKAGHAHDRAQPSVAAGVVRPLLFVLCVLAAVVSVAGSGAVGFTGGGGSVVQVQLIVAGHGKTHSVAGPGSLRGRDQGRHPRVANHWSSTEGTYPGLGPPHRPPSTAPAATFVARPQGRAQVSRLDATAHPDDRRGASPRPSGPHRRCRPGPARQPVAVIEGGPGAMRYSAGGATLAVASSDGDRRRVGSPLCPRSAVSALRSQWFPEPSARPG
ncbi:MAG: hypothetical protein QOI10_3907 [Solirubrobacterales bacterium]|nr:hypothetical protein [Solirubrobacterales bacterium]